MVLYYGTRQDTYSMHIPRCSCLIRTRAQPPRVPTVCGGGGAYIYISANLLHRV